MDNCDQFYINGHWVTPAQSKTMAMINPATTEPYGLLSLGTSSDVDNAVLAAKQAFVVWSQTSREEKLAVFDRIIERYKANFDQMVTAISQEMGAPHSLSEKAQAPAGMGHFAIAKNILKSFEFERQQQTSSVRKEPIGVVGLITPWNWPINQIACKVAPALATGCTMVLKPSEQAPLSAYLLAKIFDEAQVPAGVFNLINGTGVDVGTPLCQHPDVDMISFTGSTAAGIAISKNAATSVKRVALELGGKSANIICEDADLEKALSTSLFSCFNNTGQTCTAPTRVLIPQHQMEQAIAIASACVVKATKGVGDPSSPATRIGPVASKMQFDKVNSLIQRGIDEGATLVAGGVTMPEQCTQGYFVSPTVFANVDNAMDIAQQEIFGPVVCLIGYQDNNDAIKIANDSPYGLAAYVQSTNLEQANSIANQIRAGMVHINGAPADFTLPFGGYKQSGNGREWGEAGFEDFLETKSVLGAYER